MDRCRCDDYQRAVEKLRFYTVGTHRPDIIEKYDRSGFTVNWIKQGISSDDRKFLKPKAHKILKYEELPESNLPEETKKIKQMWCPYLTPIKRG